MNTPGREFAVADDMDLEQRRRSAVRTAIALAVLAVIFYFGFMVLYS